MCCCKTDCTWLAIITGILVGVLLGVLYSLGFVATGIIFWAYLAIGVLGVLISPVYASETSYGGNNCCFCRFKNLFLTGAVLNIIASAIGLVVAGVASTTIVAIVIGFATLFAVIELVAVICFTNCICNS
ncbi:MAG: hypothetical protein IJD36_06370 [Clostridia bacterium]|nr:hypothetical protein [Clostridia bacterium]